MTTLALDAPVADPADHRTAMLPRPLTAFVGRARELNEAVQLLADTRLLTLLGAGGSGKTRFAIELASREAPRFAGGTFWVDLAQLSDQSLVLQQIADVLGVRDEGTGGIIAALAAVLRQRSALLVLDNCEHLIESAAAAADALLRRCPQLAILATSREPLAITGERAWLIPLLSVPADGTLAPEHAIQTEAVQLFVDRARDVQPGFSLTASNVAAVSAICRRLDGVPLAIELAAARVRALGPEQIASRLDDAFSLLTSGSRVALPRHRTLRATMEWSARLLTDPEQTLFRRLGVFSGGFTLEAVEAVCPGGELASASVLDLLTQLVDRSLVTVRDSSTTARYYLLETVRQYALEQLGEAGEHDTFAQLHASYLVTLLQSTERLLTSDQRVATMARLDPELDNIRAALRWSRVHARATHVPLAAALGWYWHSSRLWTEGRRYLEDALTLPEAAARTMDRARLLYGVGMLAALQGDVARAVAVLQESMAIADEHDDERARAWAEVYLSIAVLTTGSVDGLQLAIRAGAWFAAHGELEGERIAELMLGMCALSAGDVPRAVQHCEKGLRLAEQLGLDREIAIAQQSVSHAVLQGGDLDRAGALARASVERLLRDPWFLFIARGIELIGLVACDRGRFAEGTRLLSGAELLRETVGAQLFQVDIDRYLPRLDKAREQLGQQAFEAARAEGRALDQEALVALAMAEEVVQLPAPSAVPVLQPSSTLDVRVLGPLEIRLHGELLSADAWRSARPRELFLYLLLHPDGRTREQIGLAFWPEASAAQLRNSFHVTLHHVRKALGRTDAVVVDRDRYRIGPALRVSCDALQLINLLRPALRKPASAEHNAELSTLLALYRGPLLQGERVGDWHLELHDHLQRLAADGHWLLASRLIAAGDAAAVIPVLERLVQIDDLREDAQRALMEAYAATGARARALTQYRIFAERLQRELEATPEDETVAVFERIRGAGG